MRSHKYCTWHYWNVTAGPSQNLLNSYMHVDLSPGSQWRSWAVESSCPQTETLSPAQALGPIQQSNTDKYHSALSCWLVPGIFDPFFQDRDNVASRRTFTATKASTDVMVMSRWHPCTLCKTLPPFLPSFSMET